MPAPATPPLGTIWPLARTQTLVQLTAGLLRRLDERAAREGRSRSALIRDAIKDYLHDEERTRITREIIEGYERIPPTQEEMKIAEANAREAVEEEPW
jgi:metal-responsive CopG/Arc/MetJ family transcriptional regulator